MAKRILICFLWAATAFAAEVVPALEVNGVLYRDVKFGPVNQDKIVLFHSRGVITVPVSSLPEEYQQRFTPAKPAGETLPVPREVNEPTPVQPPVQPDPGAALEAMRTKKPDPPDGGSNDWASYNRERANVVLLDGKLVAKSTLSPLIGFLAIEHMRLPDGSKIYTGAALDIAMRKNTGEKVPPAMEMRPSLWNRTDERVFLINYKPMTLVGALMKVYVVETDPIDQWRAFKVGTEPSFEDWKRLPRK